MDIKEEINQLKKEKDAVILQCHLVKALAERFLQSKVYRDMYPALFYVYFKKILDKHRKICGEAP